MLYNIFKKSLHYTYKTDETAVCYNLTAQNYAIQSIHFVIVSYISPYKSYFESHDYKTNP